MDNLTDEERERLQEALQEAYDILDEAEARKVNG